MDEDDLFQFEPVQEAAPELVLGKKKKKKKKKKEEDPAESSEQPPDPDALPDLELLKKKKKKKKKPSDVNGPSDDDLPDPKSSSALPPTSAFAALQADDGENDAPGDQNDNDDDAFVSSLMAKKKKKKSKANFSVLDLPDPIENDQPLDDNAAPAEVPLAQSQRPLSAAEKKKLKKDRERQSKLDKSRKEAEEIDAILAELGDTPASSEPAPEESNGTVEAVNTAPLTAAQKKRLKKKKKTAADKAEANTEKTPADDINTMLSELTVTDANTESQVTPATESAPQASNDVDDLLAELTVDAPATSKKKSKKKKKKAGADAGASAGQNVDDVDALLAELAPTAGTVTETGGDLEKDAQPAADGDGNDVDRLLSELGGDAGDAPAAKKKAKKKKKKGAAKADGTEGAVEGDTTEPAQPAQEGKKKKKESAAVRKMREQRERMLAEEERLQKLKEEEEELIREEERRREEEVKRKEEEKARKKAAEKARKERKRQEGTLLSKAEKEKRRKAELFKQQLMERGMIPAASKGASSETRDRPAHNRKKKNIREGSGIEERSAAEEPSQDSSLKEESVKPPVETPKEKPVEEPNLEIVPDEWDAEEDEKKDEITGEEAKLGSKGSRSLPGSGKAGRRTEADVAEENTTDEEESSEDDSEDEDDSDFEGMSKAEIAAEKRVEALRKQRMKRREKAFAARTADRLRSPVICILGHVDTGKTKILDKIRRTNVQDGEAGGITQQIGATYFPIEAVQKEATKLKEGRELSYNVPSLLIIDTPGHESFTNLRSRGSSLCDIAILVVDIMHGLEPQTRESIDLLKLRKTPFIVALNKIDRIYDWNAQPDNFPSRDSLDKQRNHSRDEFYRRVQETKLEFAEIGFNTELYWENKDVRRTVSLVPTSAITGEGIPDLLMLLLALPQRLLQERLMFSPILEATVLEVKVIEGLGTTIDIILTGGTIHEGDTIMVVGLDGPIVTTIRALLTPHPMKEMRVKGQYLHHKEIVAAQGIKIAAEGLEKAVAGTQLVVVEDADNEDEMRYAREEVMKDYQTILTNVDRSGLGVYVQASTLGSLEALLEFLKTSKIPVSGINIGPVHKRDVTKASTMLEKRKEFATVLAFDVGVEKEAQELAEEVGVTIFTADIIYHLFDKFTAHMDDMKKRRREQVNDDVVFPSISRILQQHVYNKKDPIVVGVDILDGILRVGTPLAVRKNDGWLDIGRVASIELNKKQVATARKGESVAVKIQDKTTEHIMYGRHFDFQDQVVSKMSRHAIDLLKENFRDDLETEDWRLVVKLKKMFDIM